ncbi:hypothetical protein diail_1655 [Diaporthe ilicicola]|nr:hypothetical protein diail_1655 [Diaporthe ilicicola]
MSDNLCGPSAPTKGLVGHLDRDRTLQQDRVAGSPASAAGSFRSTPQETTSTASADAAFANFTSATPQPNGAASQMATQGRVAQPVDRNPNHNPFLWMQYRTSYRGRVDIPLDTGPDKFDHENHVNQPIPARRGGIEHHRPSAALEAAQTSWANEFKRKTEENMLRYEMDSMRLPTRSALPMPHEGVGPYGPIPLHMLPIRAPGDGSFGYGQPSFAQQGGYYYPPGSQVPVGNVTPHPSYMMPTNAPPWFGPTGPAVQGGRHLARRQPAEQDIVAPHGYSASGTSQTGPNGVPFSHYPQHVALAANTEEALSAAFAAYDQDFEGEMDQWVADHGPEDRHDHEAIMTKHANEVDDARKKKDPKVLSQLHPKNRYLLKKREDHELQVYAAQIISTMARSDNAKFAGSSFADLMRRIVNREVVIEGDDLIDVATGKPTDTTPRPLGPIIQVPDMPATFIPPPDAELRAKQEAELRAKQEAELSAELSAKQEAEPSAKQEAEPSAKQEAEPKGKEPAVAENSGEGDNEDGEDHYPGSSVNFLASPCTGFHGIQVPAAPGSRTGIDSELPPIVEKAEEMRDLAEVAIGESKQFTPLASPLPPPSPVRFVSPSKAGGRT